MAGTLMPHKAQTQCGNSKLVTLPRDVAPHRLPPPRKKEPQTREDIFGTVIRRNPGPLSQQHNHRPLLDSLGLCNTAVTVTGHTMTGGGRLPGHPHDTEGFCSSLEPLPSALITTSSAPGETASGKPSPLPRLAEDLNP